MKIAGLLHLNIVMDFVKKVKGKRLPPCFFVKQTVPLLCGGEDAEQIGPEILYLRGKAVDKKDRDMIQ